ncbi:MAG: hypothetical protein ACLUEU_01245 [Oscillospiraceae bacterium]
MHNNASVTENKAFGNDATLNSAGVYVTGRNTTFTMHNSARVTKHGVRHRQRGDNDNGGGVYVSVSGQNGKFRNERQRQRHGQHGNRLRLAACVRARAAPSPMNYKASVSGNQRRTTAAAPYASGGSRVQHERRGNECQQQQGNPIRRCVCQRSGHLHRVR